MRGRTHLYGYNGILPFHLDLSLKDVPDTLDWRLYGNSNMHASLIVPEVLTFLSECSEVLYKPISS